MLVFLDIETTGHGEVRGAGGESILEVGVVVTDDALNVLGEFQQLVQPIHLHLEAMAPEVVAMHTKNGLLAEIEEQAASLYSQGKQGIRRYEAEQRLVNFMSKFPVPEGGLQLVGNSVWFDLIFIREHMPLLAKFFSRRVVDLTAINQLASRWAPGVYEFRPRGSGNHRALDDAHLALKTLRYYAGKILPNACNPGEGFTVNPPWKVEEGLG